MASFVIHLAIAKEYLEKHKENNPIDFEEGNIAPDLATDKILAHYGPITAKPSLYRYLQENPVDNSYNRGYFLHLATDYLFYNYLIHIDDVLEKIGIDSWKKMLYNDYGIINNFVIDTYQLKVPEKIKKYMNSQEGTLSLFTKKDLINFISKMSNVNLDVIQQEIKNKKDVIEVFTHLTK